MDNESGYNPEKEKPALLYHASRNRDIAKFIPRAERVRSADEGPRVFAGTDMAEAAAHMIESDDSWSSIGKSNGVRFAVFGDRQRFTELDRGGAMYVLPSDSFAVDQPNEHPDEWTSAESVTPIEKIDYQSALDAMLDSGVQVFFVESKELENIKTAAGTEKIVGVLNGLVSENERLGRNAEKIPEIIDRPVEGK